MIQEKYGHHTWNEILASSKVESHGVYTAAETYKDEEATKLLEVICIRLKAKSDDVLNIFGIYLIKYFHKKYPHFFNGKDFPNFLCSVDSIVHAEIRKLSPDSTPPRIQTQILSPTSLSVVYISNRKLCALAKGLLKGASQIYGINVEIDHTKCVNDGHQNCEFIVKTKQVNNDS
jgi:predicted hydrocarbon binding protein